MLIQYKQNQSFQGFWQLLMVNKAKGWEGGIKQNSFLSLLGSKQNESR